MQYYSGPRDYDIPDTEDPEILKKLDFVSPKAGVYRPANPQSKGMGVLDFFPPQAGFYRPANPQSKGMRVPDLFPTKSGVYRPANPQSKGMGTEGARLFYFI